MVDVEKSFELKYAKNKNNFQVLVDFDGYIQFKKDPINFDLNDVLADFKIFKDQKRGELAPESLIRSEFGNKSEEEVLREIILNGECQIPTSYLNKLRDEKKEQIVSYIVENSINPITKAKYTPTMIEVEFEKLRFNIDPNQDTVKQAEDAIKQIKKSIPLSIDKSIIETCIPPEHCGNFYGEFRKLGKITKEYYDEQGQLRLHIEVTSSNSDRVIEFIKSKSNNEASYHKSQV